MKKSLFFILSSLTTLLQAQKITYSFSNEFETVQKHVDLGFYKFSNKEYAEVYYRQGDDMIFQIFDESFKNVRKQEIALLPEGSKKFEHESF